MTSTRRTSTPVSSFAVPTARRTAPRRGADRRCDAWGSCDCWCTRSDRMGEKSSPPRRWTNINHVILLRPVKRVSSVTLRPLDPAPGVSRCIKAVLTSTSRADRVRGASVEALPARAVRRRRQGRSLPGEQERATTPPCRSPAALTPPESFLRETVATRGVELEHLLARDDAAAVRPGLPRVDEGRHQVRARRRQVVQLGAVGLDVVELPRAAVLPDQLPEATAYGAVALVLPEEVALAGVGLAAERGQQAHALHGRHVVPVALRRVAGTGRVGDGGQHVDELARDPAQ